MGLGPLVIMNFRGRKEYLSLVSASWKVQESQADRQNRPMTVTDKQRHRLKLLTIRDGQTLTLTDSGKAWKGQMQRPPGDSCSDRHTGR